MTLIRIILALAVPVAAGPTVTQQAEAASSRLIPVESQAETSSSRLTPVEYQARDAEIAANKVIDAVKKDFRAGDAESVEKRDVGTASEFAKESQVREAEDAARSIVATASELAVEKDQESQARDAETVAKQVVHVDSASKLAYAKESQAQDAETVANKVVHVDTASELAMEKDLAKNQRGRADRKQKAKIRSANKKRDSLKEGTKATTEASAVVQRTSSTKVTKNEKRRAKEHKRVKQDTKKEESQARDSKSSTEVKKVFFLDNKTDVPFSDLEPFGREERAQELTEASIKESNRMVDEIEKAEVAETKRSVFRALTRLRGAAVASFDGVAKAQVGNIDVYAKENKFRESHDLKHLAEEEDDVEAWAFPTNADFF